MNSILQTSRWRSMKKFTPSCHRSSTQNSVCILSKPLPFLFFFLQCLVNADEAELLLNNVDESSTRVAPLNGSSSTPTASPLSPPHTLPHNTSAKVPSVFGMRVELPAEDPFGYDQYGVCSVSPNEQFKVVIYGNHLDKLEKLYFTLTNNCSDAIVSRDPVNDFMTHFSHKLEDISTWLTTEKPPKKYFLPLPAQIAVIGCLLCLSALFSGLTLGLMSLTPMELELVQKSGSKREQGYASKILPIRKKGNQLLCALLLGNVIVNAAISILFGELTSGLLALFISSVGIVIFGEIVPQSICVKQGLAVGAHTISITQFFIFLTYPVAWPISKLLDCLLGDEYQGYDRKRLMELMKMSLRHESGQISNELKIAVGAMEIADKVAQDVMTKIDDVFMLPDTTVLNANTVAKIVQMGYTRIPVYNSNDRNNVTDILIVKDLALLDPDDNFTVKTVCGYHQHPVKVVLSETPLGVLLESFKKGEGHLAMVKRELPRTEASSEPSFELIGLITLEDIVEEILQAEIVDEFDVITDNKNRTRRKNAPVRDLSKIFEKEAPVTQISTHIQMVTLQFLVSNEEAFTERYISKSVLEKLISTCTRRVDISYLKSVQGENSGKAEMAVPRIAKLYMKDELSDRYILILEGRAKVTIGQSGMMFEAGPFHSFGSEILQTMVRSANTLTRSFSIADTPSDETCRRPDLMFTPDYTVVITEDCTYLEITIGSYINAYKSTLMQRERVTLSRRSSSLSSSSTMSPHTVPGLTLNGINGEVPSLQSPLHGSLFPSEALRALNAREQNHKQREPIDEEELNLFKKELTALMRNGGIQQRNSSEEC